jgi:hypothetical protein
MYKVKNMGITESVLAKWNERFLPPFDYFYFEDITTATELLSNDIVITTRKELSADLDTLTAFSPWRVSKEAKYVAIVPNDFFNTLDEEIKQKVLIEQLRVGRGQLWERKWVESILDQVDQQYRQKVETIIKQSTFSTSDKEIVAFNRMLWDQLPTSVRYVILVNIAELYIKHPSIWSELPHIQQNKIKEENPHVLSYFDRFSEKNGPNCFATALAGSSKNKTLSHWTISQWIKQEALMIGLRQKGYDLHIQTTDLSEDMVKAGDIIIWSNEDHVHIHAAYSLGDGLAFNKDGQTMFNPWQVLKLLDVSKSWEATISIFRKK